MKRPRCSRRPTTPARWAGRLTLPSFFYAAIGASIALQIGTTAYGIAVDSLRARVALGVGLLLFSITAVVRLLRFRSRNGVWISGLASRVVLGTANGSSTAHTCCRSAQPCGPPSRTAGGSWV